MRAVEALERLIAMGDELLGIHPTQRPANGEDTVEDDKAAVAICQAMVNTAIPIGRFRVHAEVEEVLDRKSSIGLCDFTVCASHIASIRVGLRALLKEDLNVRVTLWEQKTTGAEMLSGYQGRSKSQNFRIWFRDIISLQELPEV